ncbi:Transmembrane protein 18 [Glycine soja]
MGIRCSNLTGHVIMLDLNGNLPSQLGNLPSCLDISFNLFEGNIPSQLGNHSNFQDLYHGEYKGGALKIDDGNQCLSNLISLTHLHLSFIPNDLHTSHSWLQMIAKLPKLRELRLIDCSLSDHFILSLRPSKFNFSTCLLVVYNIYSNIYMAMRLIQRLSLLIERTGESKLTKRIQIRVLTNREVTAEENLLQLQLLLQELRSAMEEHMDLMADLVQKFSSDLRAGFRPAYDNFIGFFHAIDWKEPWLMGLLGFHVVLLLVAIISRKKTNFQIFLGKNWKNFSSQNYFDPSGLFMSVLWSGPLLVISMIILINTLFSLCYMIVRWKRAELRHRARAARNKQD